MAEEPVSIKVEGDVNDILNSLDKVTRSLDKFDKEAKQAGAGADKAIKQSGDGILGTFKKIAAGAAVAFAVKQIYDYGKAAIDAASDLNEAGTAVEAVFGPAYDSIRKWAEGAATGLGQSTLAALDAAKTFGVFGDQAGLAAAENAKFSQNLVGLAGDLASFHNADPTDVIQAIGGALRGEVEPLRKYGILINQASLESAALKAGIIDVAGPLTAQQKILATNALMYDMAGAAVGDFQKTSDGLANQQRIAAAQWTDLSAKIGTVFLPAVTGVVSFFNSTLMPVLNKGADSLVTGLGPAFANMGETIGPFLDVMKSTFLPIFKEVGPQVLELVMALSPLGMVLKAIQPVLPTISNLLGTMAEILSGTLSAVLPIITSLVEQLATMLATGLSTALPIVVSLMETLAGALELVLPAVMMVAEAVGGALLGVFEALTPLLPPLLGLFSGVLEAVLPIIPPILDLVMAFAPLIEVVGELIGAILPPLVELLMAVLGPILELISPLMDLLAPAIEFVADVIGVLVGWISDVITWFIDMNAAAEEAGGGMSGQFKMVGDVIGGVVDFIGGVITWVAALIKKSFDQVVNTVKTVGSVFSSVFGAIGSFVSDAFNNAVATVKGGVNAIIGLVNGAIGHINRVKVTVPDWVPFLGGQTFGINLPKIPYLAKGGRAVAPGLSWVGERGPELVKLPRGAEVVPLGHNVDLGGGGGGTQVHNEYNITIPSRGNRQDDAELADRLVSTIRFYSGEGGEPE